jgi:hypothetical protein
MSKTYQQISRAPGHTSVIIAMWVAYTEGSQTEDGLSKKYEALSENYLRKKKNWECGSNGRMPA